MEISSDEEVEGPPAPKATGVSLVDRVNSFSWTPPYVAPEGKWSSPQALSHNNRNYCEYCMVCGKHATEAHLMSASHNHLMQSWIARNRPGLRLLPDRLSDPERVEMMIQLRMPDLTEPEIKKARELVLQPAWFSNQPAKADVSTLPPQVDAKATAKSSNALPGIWAEPPEPPRAVERRVLPSQPEVRRVKARGRPWPDTLGVQLRVDAPKFAYYGFGELGCLDNQEGEASTGWQRGSTTTDPTQGGGSEGARVYDAQDTAQDGAIGGTCGGGHRDGRGHRDGARSAIATQRVVECAASGTSATTGFGSTNIFVGATQLPTSGCSDEFAQRREFIHEDEARHLYGGRSRLLEGCSGDGHRISASASAHRIADPTSCSYREPAYFKPNGERSGATTGTATGCATTGTSSGNAGYQPAATSAKETFSQPDPVIFSQLSKPDAMNNGLFALPTHRHAWKHSGVHALCEFCGQPCSVFSSAAVVAPLQEEDPLNQKNHNKEPDTQPEGPAGLGLAAGQGELIMSQDPETRRELHKRLSHVSQGHVPVRAVKLATEAEG
ncbi:unnamed protein product [Symbiodinium sp. CCMP2592]|nr:unnamed protein product [Symbiodinium sp. CCMP2592]